MSTIVRIAYQLQRNKVPSSTPYKCRIRKPSFVYPDGCPTDHHILQSILKKLSQLFVFSGMAENHLSFIVVKTITDDRGKRAVQGRSPIRCPPHRHRSN